MACSVMTKHGQVVNIGTDWHRTAQHSPAILYEILFCKLHSVQGNLRYGSWGEAAVFSVLWNFCHIAYSEKFCHDYEPGKKKM